MSGQSPQSAVEQRLGGLYDLITGDEDARVCKDIPDSACHHQPRNFFAYLVANLFGKIADELISARLTLPWLLSVLGAPGAFTGFLVPIREAGVLVPQLVVAAYIRRMRLRKYVWLLGAGLSALSLVLMALIALGLKGVAAGWVVLILLIVFSLARGLCSVSAKDVLGKTVSKTRRGTLMGYSVAISSLAVLAVGAYLEYAGAALQSASVFRVLLLAAAACWVVGIVVFALIREVPGATEGGGNAIAAAVKSLMLLVRDRPFRRYVIGRILLLSVALLPPFFVMLAQQHSHGGLSGLGWLIIANGIAGSLSAVVWGRLSDRSSRLVMAIGAVLTGVVGIATFVLSIMGSPLLDGAWLYPFLFFLIIIAHGGVRLGRKVYLVDMATVETRSSYVAVSNTVIGLAMLLAGSVGLIADAFGTLYAILSLSLFALIAAVYAMRMPDVSG